MFRRGVFTRGRKKKEGGRGGRGRLRFHRDREGRKAQALGQKHVSPGIGAGLRWEEGETVGDDLYRATSTLPSATDPSSPPPQTRSLSLRSSPVPKSYLQHPHRPVLTPLRPAHRSWSGEGGVADAGRAVCPPHLLQWELLRREGGPGEGWWLGWKGGEWRSRGFRAVGEGGERWFRGVF